MSGHHGTAGGRAHCGGLEGETAEDKMEIRYKWEDKREMLRPGDGPWWGIPVRTHHPHDRFACSTERSFSVHGHGRF